MSTIVKIFQVIAKLDNHELVDASELSTAEPG